jgi:hypothetical protein
MRPSEVLGTGIAVLASRADLGVLLESANNEERTQGYFKMRSRLFLSLLGTVTVLAASAAQAGVLSNATWTQATQGFPLTRSTIGYCPTNTPGCDPLVASGTSTATSIAVSLDYPFITTKFFVPKTPNGSIDLAVNITQGGVAGITATAGMANVTAGGIPGTAFVMSGVHNTKGVNQSTFLTGVNTIVMVSLNAGIAGQFTGSFIVIGINHLITVDFYAWTGMAASFTGLTSKGVASPDVTAPGSWNLSQTANGVTDNGLTIKGGPGTANNPNFASMTSNGNLKAGAGVVTLVSPSKISIDCSLAQRRTAGFTSVQMWFVPEPGFLLMLGAGGLSLVLFGSRRR